MIDLKKESNVSNSRDMNVASMQLIEQKFWDLIDEVNLDFGLDSWHFRVMF